MPGEVRVPVRLEVIQSSINTVKAAMDSLKPNSSGWRELQKILQSMQKEANNLQITMSKPFSSQSQFTQAEKGINKLENALDQARLTMSRIDFSDLKLDTNQQAVFDGFKRQLQDIQNEAKTFKASLKQSLQMSDAWEGIQKLDPNTATHSFDEIVKAVQNKVKTLQKNMQDAQKAFDNFQPKLKSAKFAEQFASNKDNSFKAAMGEDFSKFFVNGNQLKFKSGQKNPFYQFIQENLQLDSSQIEAIKQAKTHDLEQIFKDLDLSKILSQARGTISEGQNKQTNLNNANIAYKEAQRTSMVLGQSLDQLKTEEEELSQKTNQVNSGLQQFQTNATEAARNSTSFSNGVTQANQGLEGMRNQLKQSNAEMMRYQRTMSSINSLKMTVTNFMGFTQVLNIVKKGVREAIQHIHELDDVMNGISVVTNMSTGDLWDQIDAYSSMASKYGVSIKGAYEVSRIYYQQGLETADVMTLTNETLKLAKISGLDYATTTDYMTTALRGFKMEMSDAGRVVDVYSNLAAHTAVSSEELAVAMSKTASSMESVGSTFEESSAMIATMVAVTRESATNIGSALKSIAARYGEMKKDPGALKDLEGEALSYNKVDAALQSVGISLKDSQGEFRNMTDVVLELAEVWDQLDSTQQRYIATQFAGNRQQSRFLALVSNKDLLKSNLNYAQESEGTGDTQAEKTLDSISSKLEQAKVAYQEFYTSIGLEDLFKGALDGVKEYINYLNRLPKAFGDIPIAAIGMVMNLINAFKLIGQGLLSGLGKIFDKIIPVEKISSDFSTAMREGAETGAHMAGEVLRQEMSHAAQDASQTMTQQSMQQDQTAEQPMLKNKEDVQGYLQYAGAHDILTEKVNAIQFNNANDPSAEIQAKFEAIFSEVAANNERLKVAFAMAGDDAVAGYVNSLIAGMGQISNAGAQIGNVSVEGLRNAIGAHSPATETMITGQDYVDGYIQGINAKISEAAQTGGKVGRDTLASLEESLKINPTSFESLKSGIVKELEKIPDEIIKSQGYTRDALTSKLSSTTYDQYKAGDADSIFYKMAQNRMEQGQQRLDFGSGLITRIDEVKNKINEDGGQEYKDQLAWLQSLTFDNFKALDYQGLTKPQQNWYEQLTKSIPQSKVGELKYDYLVNGILPKNADRKIFSEQDITRANLSFGLERAHTNAFRRGAAEDAAAQAQASQRQAAEQAAKDEEARAQQERIHQEQIAKTGYDPTISQRENLTRVGYHADVVGALDPNILNLASFNVSHYRQFLQQGNKALGEQEALDQIAFMVKNNPQFAQGLVTGEVRKNGILPTEEAIKTARELEETRRANAAAATEERVKELTERNRYSVPARKITPDAATESFIRGEGETPDELDRERENTEQPKNGLFGKMRERYRVWRDNRNEREYQRRFSNTTSDLSTELTPEEQEKALQESLQQANAAKRNEMVKAQSNLTNLVGTNEYAAEKQAWDAKEKELDAQIQQAQQKLDQFYAQHPELVKNPQETSVQESVSQPTTSGQVEITTTPNDESVQETGQRISEEVQNVVDSNITEVQTTPVDENGEPVSGEQPNTVPVEPPKATQVVQPEQQSQISGNEIVNAQASAMSLQDQIHLLENYQNPLADLQQNPSSEAAQKEVERLKGQLVELNLGIDLNSFKAVEEKIQELKAKAQEEVQVPVTPKTEPTASQKAREQFGMVGLTPESFKAQSDKMKEAAQKYAHAQAVANGETRGAKISRKFNITEASVLRRQEHYANTAKGAKVDATYAAEQAGINTKGMDVGNVQQVNAALKEREEILSRIAALEQAEQQQQVAQNQLDAAKKYNQLLEEKNNGGDVDEEELKRTLSETGTNTELGQSIGQEAMAELQQQATEANNAVTNCNNALQEQVNAQQQGADAARQNATAQRQAAQAQRQAAQEAAQNRRKVGGVVRGLSSIMSMATMFVDKESEVGQRISGGMTAASGVMNIAGGFMTGGWAGALMSLATSMPMIISGITQIFHEETAAEKQEKLKKESEELNKEAQEKSKKYSSLQSKVEELNTLKESQYDSKEASEQYHSAVNDLVDTYPQLIAGFDSMGDAIYNAAMAEELLRNARQESAEAAYTAAMKEAEKERQAADEQLENTDYHFKLGTDEIGIKANDISTEEAVAMMWDWGANEQAWDMVRAGTSNIMTAIHENGAKYSYRDINSVEGLNLSQEKKDAWLDFITAYTGRDEDSILYHEDGKNNGKTIESYDVINSLGHDALSYLESIGATEAIQKYEEAGLIGTSGDIRYLNMPELYSAFLGLKESEEYKDINFADAAAQGLLYDSGVNQIRSLIRQYNDLISSDRSRESAEELLIVANQIQQVYSGLNDAQRKMIDLDPTSLSNNVIAINSWAQAYKNLEGYYTRGAAMALDARVSNMTDINFLKENSQLQTIVSESIGKQAYEENWSLDPDAFSKEILNHINEGGWIIEQAKSFQNILDTNEEREKQFSTMVSAPERYSAADIESLFPEIDGALKDAIEEHLSSIKKQAQGEITGALSSYYGASVDVKERFGDLITNTDTWLEADIVDQMTAQAKYYQEQFGRKVSDGYLDAALEIYQQIEQITDIEKRNKALDIIKKNGVKTKAGLTTSQAELEQLGLDQQIDLTDWIEHTYSNIGLGIQTVNNSIDELWSSLNEKSTKALKGTDAQGIQALIEEAKSFNIDLTLDDFQRDGNEFILNAERYKELQDQILSDITLSITNLNTDLQEANTNLTNMDALIATRTDGQLALALDLVGLNYKSYFNENGNLKEGIDNNKIKEDYKNAIDKLSTELKQTGSYAQYLRQQQLYSLLKTGDFSSILIEYEDDSLSEAEKNTAKFKHLIELATNENYTDAELLDKNIETTVKGIQSSYNKFLSDLLSKGIENIDWSDYEYITKDLTYSQFGLSDTSSNYEFVSAIGSSIGATRSEMNDLLVQAIEKDNARFSESVLENLNFISGDIFTTDLAGLKELANTYNLDIAHILENEVYDPVNDTIKMSFDQLINYIKEVDPDFDYTQIHNLHDTIQESFDSMMSSITDTIKNGIEGTLDLKGVREIKDFLVNRGINLDLNFSHGTKGYKLAIEDAKKLYHELEQIDSISAQIALDALNESLSEADEHFKSVSAIEAHIVELQRKIYGNYQQRSGNVNLISHAEHQITGESMIAAGWNDFNAEDYATLYSSTYSGEEYNANFVLNITPITNDGTEILSPADLDAYVANLLQDSTSIQDIYSKDTKGLVMGAWDVDVENAEALSQGIKVAEEEAQRLHAESDAIVSNMNAMDEVDNGRINQYKEELALAKEIQAIRATTEDSSFSFMSNKIPEAQNNPLNYFSNWQQAFQAISEANKNKQQMDYTTFYNIVTEMGHLADMTGELPVGAGRVLHNSEEASNLITEAANYLTVAADGSIKIDLTKFGVDFFTGASDMNTSIQDGIKKFAQSEVDMLDSMIQLMETIVAMEQLGDIDVEGNGIDFSDLFKSTYNQDTRQWERDFEQFSEGYKRYRNYVLERIDKEKYPEKFNEDLANGVNNTRIKVGGQEFIFGDLLKLEPAKLHEQANGELGEAYAAVLQAYKQAALSGDYSESSIFTSIKEVLTESGFSGEIDLGNMHLIFKAGDVITTVKDSEGNIHYYGEDGTDLGTDLNKAKRDVLIKDLEQQSKRGSSEKITYNEEENKIKLNINDTDVELQITDDGQLSVEGKLYDGLDDYYRKNYEAINTKWQGNLEAWKIEQELVIVPTITQDGALSKDTIEKLRADGLKSYDDLKDAWSNLTTDDEKIEFKAKYGIDLNGIETLEADTEKIKELNKVLADKTETVVVTVVNDQALSAISAVQDALDKLDNADVTVTVTQHGDVSATGNVQAKGNAMSQGTLMGELGPELVVSNGHYFVAGQNGAEFVDLDPDAIVFNHLQTESLFKNGMSKTRGKAVTNERVATSFAKGNVNGGPAQASASQALAALKQLRNQWKAIAELDPSQMAGTGGGGGGGGDPKAFLKDLEKWYNWLQKIAQLEKEINQQEALRSKLQSDMVPRGKEYVQSQVQTLEALQQTTAIEQSLVDSQQDYFNKERERLNTEGSFKALYTFNEGGQLVYQPGKLEWLSDLFGRDSATGKANYTSKEQYEMLVAAGYADVMKYDASGNEIKQEGEDWYATAVQAFSDKMDADNQGMQSIYDSIQEHKVAVLDAQTKINEIVKSIEDNEIQLSDKVLSAIESARQREIDELQKERDAIEKASKSLLDGLSQQLSKEREMYSQQQSENDLSKLQRQLAILQRSGGSTSQINDLQRQISEKQQDMYFDAQQKEIDALQEASDNEIKRLDQQIELMTETLEYEKKHGMLWEDVNVQLAKSPEEIADFIRKQDDALWGESPVKQIQTDRENLFMAQEYKEYQSIKDKIDEIIEKTTDEGVKKESEKINDEANSQGKWIQSEDGRWWYQHKDNQWTENDWEKIDDKWYHFDQEGWMQTGWLQDQGKWYHLGDSGAMDTGWYQDPTSLIWYYLDEITGEMLANTTKELEENGKRTVYTFDEEGRLIDTSILGNNNNTTTNKEKNNNTKQDLTSDQMAILHNDLVGKGTSSSISNNLSKINDATVKMLNKSIIDQSSGGITFGDINVQVDVDKIANDYDARNAGGQMGDGFKDAVTKALNKSPAKNSIGGI